MNCNKECLYSKLKRFKTIKYFILISFFINSCMVGKGYENTSKDDSLIFILDFQDNFTKSDKVFLSINGCEIFSNREFESDSILGFTRKVLTGQRKENNLVVYFEMDTIICKNKDFKNLKFEILVNKTKKEYLFNIDKGKYIGVSKSSSGVNIIQQNKEFVYD